MLEREKTGPLPRQIISTVEEEKKGGGDKLLAQSADFSVPLPSLPLSMAPPPCRTAATQIITHYLLLPLLLFATASEGGFSVQWLVLCTATYVRFRPTPVGRRVSCLPPLSVPKSSFSHNRRRRKKERRASKGGNQVAIATTILPPPSFYFP